MMTRKSLSKMLLSSKATLEDLACGFWSACRRPASDRPAWTTNQQVVQRLMEMTSRLAVAD